MELITLKNPESELPGLYPTFLVDVINLDGRRFVSLFSEELANTLIILEQVAPPAPDYRPVDDPRVFEFFAKK